MTKRSVRSRLTEYTLMALFPTLAGTFYPDRSAIATGSLVVAAYICYQELKARGARPPPRKERRLPPR
jgi:hypothetical protein